MLWLNVAPPRARQALTATLAALDRARLKAAGGSAALTAAMLAALDPVLRAPYPDHPARLADLHRLADGASSHPSLHDALVELALDEGYLVISTIHAAKGLEWPIVHLPHLVDGAIPSDMNLATRDGLDEEHRLFYVALTRARDQLHLYAPHRLHHHRRAPDDRHSLGQLTRFLTPTPRHRHRPQRTMDGLTAGGEWNRRPSLVQEQGSPAALVPLPKRTPATARADRCLDRRRIRLAAMAAQGCSGRRGSPRQ